MSQKANTTTTLHDTRIPVQAKLAAAWASFMFLYIYVDYFHLYKPGVVDGILTGVVGAGKVGAVMKTRPKLQTPTPIADLL